MTTALRIYPTPPADFDTIAMYDYLFAARERVMTDPDQPAGLLALIEGNIDYRRTSPYNFRARSGGI